MARSEAFDPTQASNARARLCVIKLLKGRLVSSPET